MSVRSLAASSFVTLLTVLAGCVSPPLSQEGTNAALMTRLLEDMDGGSFALFDQLCAPRHRLHAPGRVEPLGCAAQKRSLRELRRAFSDLDQRVDDVFGAGDKVTFRLTQSGTHTGEFLGIPPTGAEVKFRVLGVARFANGQMIEMWLDLDWPTLFDQVGTTPRAWHRRWLDRLDPLPPLDAQTPSRP